MENTQQTSAKKKVNGKRKGNAGERAVAAALTESLAPFVFKRIQSSGAVLGGKNAVNLDHYTDAGKCAFVGDVFCSNDEQNKFRFCIESKNYKDNETLEHLFNPRSRIYGWLDEVRIDAKKINKDGIVIFKFTRTPFYCAVDPHVTFPDDVPYIKILNDIKVCHFDDLLKHNDFWFK